MSSSTLPLQDDATVVVRVCPKCGAPNALAALQQTEYRCGSCGFDMAYLDVTTTGAIRGVLGWVRREGEVLCGRYRVASVLGRGGFGATYLVQDVQLNGKRRAVKEIPVAMFDEAEAALLARVDHPAVPDIIDRVIAEDMVYLVLRFGGSRTLGSERKRLGGRIPPATLLPWMQQLCKVLSYLHRQNPPIIHRDLKPDNILLDEEDHVMLIDFGIAKLSEPSEATRTLGRAVSIGFSSPEQVLGTGTDQRSDIYSLGATFYYLLTGRHVPAMNAQLSGQKVESLASVVPEIPVELDRAILRTVDLNPGQRPQSVTEIEQVLDALVRDQSHGRPGASAGENPAPERKNVRMLAAIVGGLLLFSLAAMLAWRLLAPSEPDQKPDEIPAPPATPSIPKPPEPTPAPSVPPVPEPAKPAGTTPEPAPVPQVTPPPAEKPAASVPDKPAGIPTPPDQPSVPAKQKPKAPKRIAEPQARPLKQEPKSKPAAPRRSSPPRAEQPARPSRDSGQPDWSNAFSPGGARKTYP